MIVEDDSGARSGLAELLARDGFRVTTAADGVDALEKLEAGAVDLMLLDVWMPRMDGLQVLGHLKDRHPRPKVIMMTADDTPETVLLSLTRDAYQFIHKPIRPAALLEMLHGTLNGNGATAQPSFVVLSARPGWVELLVPCVPGIVNRIEGFMANLEADLADDIRASVGLVFRELLEDAMSDCHLDPNRKIRIAFLRARRMLMYRIADAGYGFRVGDWGGAGTESHDPAAHAAPANHHALRPGLLVARELADEVLVNEGRNEVVFVKYLDS
jgi:CheY-like chemotaxis protein